MAIKGSLNEASLPDIIQLLSIGQKTGVLSITNRQNFGNIYLKQGNVIFANIVNREDRLGEILVRRSRISQDALDKAIEIQQQSDGQKMIGKILVEKEHITEKELVEHLQFQIEEAIQTLLTWRDGFFVFEPNRMPEEDVPQINIRTSKLVMEAARRIDEWEVMRKKIPSMNMVVRVVDREALDQASLTDLNVSEEEWRIVSFIDNERTIQDLADMSSINEFDVAKVVYGLLTSGIVELEEPHSQFDPTEVNDTKIEEFFNLGLAFLKAELYEESRKEFDKVLHAQPDDQKATFYQGLISYQMHEYERAISYLEKTLKLTQNNAPASVYNNLALVYERNEQLDKALVTLEKGLEKEPHHTKMQINLGRIIAKKGDMKRAQSILETARKKDPTAPVPRFYLANVLAKMGNYEEALSLYKKFNGANKNDAVLNNQAVIMEMNGRNKAAIDAYKSALKANPNMLKARQSLADIYYRNGWHQDALTEYQNVVEINPSSSDAYFKIGNIHMKYHEKDKALIAWEKSLELDRDNELLRRNIETVKKLKLVN